MPNLMMWTAFWSLLLGAAACWQETPALATVSEATGKDRRDYPAV
jgi:hypothetical protein